MSEVRKGDHALKIYNKHVEGRILIVPIGDIQFTGLSSKTAGGCSVRALKEHLEFANAFADNFQAKALFIGTGDYVDMISPSNREAYNAAGLYAPAKRIVAAAFADIVEELAVILSDYMRPADIVALCMGHHWFEYDKSPIEGVHLPTTDHHLAYLLGKVPIGDSICPSMGHITFHFESGAQYRGIFMHGEGNGQSLAYGLNKLDKLAGNFEQIDFAVMGHTHKSGTLKKAKLFIDGGEIKDRNVRLVTSGAFLKGFAVNDVYYPEKKGLFPIPLGGSMIYVEDRGGQLFSCAIDV